MSTYAISDIHGCYDEFMALLRKISLQEEDELILLGDYIDRGPKSYEMLKWLENVPANVVTLKGNHDDGFCRNVRMMKDFATKIKNEQTLNPKSNLDTRKLYYLLCSRYPGDYFDYYGTIERIITKNGVNLSDLTKWSGILEKLPLYEERNINGKRCIFVHAGYTEKDIFNEKSERDDYYLWARDAAYTDGGIEHGMVIAGHTPTIIEGEFSYTGGTVYRKYDEEKDCVFYDIDCGMCFHAHQLLPDGGVTSHLAALRADDGQEYYV